MTELISIETREQWQAIREGVQSLCTLAGANVFATPMWLEAAMQWQYPLNKLRLTIAEEASGYFGFAPLVLRPTLYAGIPLKTLSWLSVPDNQFIDFVVPPNRDADFAARLASHLRQRRSDWDRLQLDYLCDIYPNWRRLVEALRREGIATRVESTGTNPFVDLSGDFETYFKQRSRSLKKTLNLSSNRLDKRGSVTVDWIRSSSEVGEALKEAVRISQISWKQETGNSLDRPGPRAFIERLTEAAQQDRIASLWLLRLDGKVIATEYQIIVNGNVHALRSDFDPAYAEAGPGTYLNYQLLKRLFGQALIRYYMGPGTNAYKMRWTDVGEPMYRLVGYSPTVRGSLLRQLDERIRPIVRSLRRQIGESKTPSQLSAAK